MEKINELKKIQKLISQRKKSIETYLFLKNKNTMDGSLLVNDLIDFKKKTVKNKYLSGSLIPFKTENLFKRIICLTGKIKIHLERFGSQKILNEDNMTMLPPNINYIIETIDDSEFLTIYK